MKNQLIEAMKDINTQIKQLDKELDFIVISELRRQRFFILSTYKYLQKLGYFDGVALRLRVSPRNRNMEVSQ